uniref:CCA tRNA nucleotidyltransferase n=1 Tax=Thermodesulfobacterium geofontis TaxID=1295609 RepID=A0A7V4N397_9BACT
MKKTKIELEDFLKTILPDQKLYKFLYLAQDISKKRGEFLYFAGGVVRDYLLKKLYKKKIPKAKDLDLVLQGNLKSFLKELFEKVKGEILFESQFLTYKVKINLNGKEFLIDFITARKEVYEDIAKLPKVFPASFKEDIFRRDFTINALIIGLSPPYEGILIDLVKGEEDLKKGLIRPLHLNSFVDDPTRIFRGIRYKVRFEFNFSEDFFLALKKCFEKEALKRLSGTRLANELKLYLDKEPEKNLKDLLMTTYELNLFEKAELKTDKKNFNFLISLFKELKGEITEKEKEKFFLFGLINSHFLESLYRLGFLDSEVKELIRYKEFIKEILPNWEKLSLWEKIKTFEKIPSTYLLTLSVYFPKIKKEVVKFFKEYRKIKPELTGEEMIKLGIKEGKEIGALLDLIRKEKIEGKIKGKEEEKNLVIQFLLKKSKN